MREGNITEEVEKAAEQAKEVEERAQSVPDESTYTHVFPKPFTWQGQTFERMTFDWSTLTGKDSAAVKRELQRRNIFAIVETHSDDYLIAMAARACTDRDGDNRRVVSGQTLEALPVCEYRRIRNKIQNFLLRAEFELTTAGSGSENNARP